jgi:hypothetical protein
MHACAYGTDCTDCGPRYICGGSCEYAEDGMCDDGFTPEQPDESGEDSQTAACDPGTDCVDCGSRY